MQCNMLQKAKQKLKLKRKPRIRYKIQSFPKLKREAKIQLKALKLPLIETGEPFETFGHVAQTSGVNEPHVHQFFVLLNRKA